MLTGKKVKINVERLMTIPRSVKFTNFVDANKDKVFTARLRSNYFQSYTLDEDTSEIKWIFFENDLIEVNDDTNK